MAQNPAIIAPSILAADFGRLADQIRAADLAGADWIHIDVMDGHFVPNLTMGPLVVTACRKATKLPLDVHLMIEKPERLIKAFAEAGADSITVHVETCPHLNRTIQQIRETGCKAGVAINPSTPAVLIEPVLDLIDLALVMSVNPGFGGQKFIPSTLSKVREISGWIAERYLEVLIQMDGGITDRTIEVCWASGARVFVAGSAVFKNPLGIETAIRSLRQAIPG